MNESLQNESEKLARSWMRHEALWLRDYLVADVEDPRLNLQSILTRHFLLRSIFGNIWNGLMVEEYRFAAALSWLQTLVGRGGGQEECEAVLHALKQGADNAEGLEIPWFVVELFAQLPVNVNGVVVPNYVHQSLHACPEVTETTALFESNLDVFRGLWAGIFLKTPSSQPLPPQEERTMRQPLSVLEPACGSANDYRFFHAYGLAPWLDYTGFDLCAKNIDNARTLFPKVRFDVGNAFEIAAPDKSFDLSIVHDLFEHLSLEGMQTAIAEICRVTRTGMCIGFFQMDEIRDHVVRPLDDYYCNLLSMARMKELFAACGFIAQVIHIGTFLREHVTGAETHNPNAYTFFLRAR